MVQRTLAAEVAHSLREQILSGQYKPGDFLPTQKELANQFQVGMSTIHEATQVLVGVGLLEARPGKGTWVRQDALSSLVHPIAVRTRLGDLGARELCEARSVIEVALTELAARKATADDVAAIRTALAAMEAGLEDDTAFVEADLAFHLAVAKAAHNGLLEQFYHTARKLLEEVVAELVSLPKVKQMSIEMQGAIARAIERRNSRQAVDAARIHMSYVAKLLDAYE